MLETIEPPPYEFRHIDPVEDQELFQCLLRESAPVDGQRMQELDQLIDIGSARLDPRFYTASERASVIHARQEFTRRLGFRDPSHSLNNAYVAAIKGRDTDCISGQIFGLLKELTNISGSPQTAVGIVQNAPYLFKHTGGSVRLRHRYLERFAVRLGWQGDVGDLIREEPAVLLVSHKKIAAVGWLAAMHAGSEQQDMDNASTAALLKRPMEVLISAAIMWGEDYELGQGVDNRIYRTRDRQEAFYEELRDAVATRRAGHDVLRAYFRYRPPDDSARKKHPHLLPFLRHRMYSEKGRAAPEVPTILTGDEPWLSQAVLPAHPGQRKAWLTRLNRHIAGGSISIARNRPGNKRYEEVVDHRIKFFKLLGWTHPDREIGQGFIKFSTVRESLVFPQRVVEILNLFESYTIAITPPLLAASFPTYVCRPEIIKERLECIKSMGLDIPSLVAEKPSIVRTSISLARPILERRAALLKRPNDDMLRKHGATIPGADRAEQ